MTLPGPPCAPLCPGECQHRRRLRRSTVLVNNYPDEDHFHQPIRVSENGDNATGTYTVVVTRIE